MKIKILLMAIVGLMMSSCSTIYHTASTVDVNTKVYGMAVADLNVSPTKVQKTYSWDFNPFKRISIDIIKSNTTVELLEEANADILVEPQYIIEQGGFFSGGSVTVIGFPAKFTDFRKITDEDLKVIQQMPNCPEENKSKNRKAFIF